MKVSSTHQSARIFNVKPGPDPKMVTIPAGDSEIDDDLAEALLGMGRADKVVAAHLSGITFHGASGNISPAGRAGEDKARADKAEAENERLKARLAELEGEKPADQPKPTEPAKPAQPPKKPER